jgi:hypothetical protein
MDETTCPPRVRASSEAAHPPALRRRPGGSTRYACGRACNRRKENDDLRACSSSGAGIGAHRSRVRTSWTELRGETSTEPPPTRASEPRSWSIGKPCGRLNRAAASDRDDPRRRLSGAPACLATGRGLHVHVGARRRRRAVRRAGCRDRRRPARVAARGAGTRLRSSGSARRGSRGTDHPGAR